MHSSLDNTACTKTLCYSLSTCRVHFQWWQVAVRAHNTQSTRIEGRKRCSEAGNRSRGPVLSLDSLLRLLACTQLRFNRYIRGVLYMYSYNTNFCTGLKGLATALDGKSHSTNPSSSWFPRRRTCAPHCRQRSPICAHQSRSRCLRLPI